MKKIIYFCGLVFLSIVLVLNLVFTANIDLSEHITIEFNNIIYMLGIILLAILVYIVTKFINKKLYDDIEKKKKIRKILFISTIVIYAIFNIVWCILVRPPIVGDQIHACNLAQTFYNGNLEEFLPNMTYANIPLSEYMQAYHQQISLAFVFSLFFRIIHYDGIGILRLLNIMGNIAIAISIYKIGIQLSKKYKINKVLLLTLVTTFASLIMLSTFIYGDIPSIALCLFSVYLIMKYNETGKFKYTIIASILTMFAFMMRMNSLIFIIATVIYLLINLFNEFTKRNTKQNLIKVLIIATYIIISIIPSALVKNYYLNKYNMDKEKAYPNISYFLMAMKESWRGNGWYNEDIGEPALKDPVNKKIEYKDRIKERLIYFSKHLDYTFEFYTKKIASMWAENTYSAVRSNLAEETDPIANATKPLMVYQKTLLILMCACSLIVLLQNGKNLSIDVIFLITIFIGGFAFHILWEAKSRYIIPYILALIPVASIFINKINLKEKLKNRNEIITKRKS